MIGTILVAVGIYASLILLTKKSPYGAYALAGTVFIIALMSFIKVKYVNFKGHVQKDTGIQIKGSKEIIHWEEISKLTARPAIKALAVPALFEVKYQKNGKRGTVKLENKISKKEKKLAIHPKDSRYFLAISEKVNRASKSI